MDLFAKIRVTTAQDLLGIYETIDDLLVIVDRETTIAAGTCPMPSSPVDKQLFILSTKVAITALTMNPGLKTVRGNVTSMQADSVVGWVFEAVSNAWCIFINQAVAAGATAWGQITGTLSNQADLQAALTAKLSDNTDILAYAALGGNFLAETVGQRLSLANVSTNMTDNQIKYTAVYLPKAATITGAKFYVRVLGSYTPDQNNRIGLYSYSGGTLTLVASCANTAALWTSGANAIQTIPFTTPYAAAAGIYYVAFLYNNSAQVTGPALGSCVALNNAAMSGTAYGFTNSAKLHGTSTGNDIPASIAMTAITASTITSWVALY